MELSEATLAYLRDEAYAFLAREALLARVEDLDRERAAVSSTRPPFGVLAKRSTREAFARSMRIVDDNEAVLRDELAQVTGITDWLQPIIRQEVSTYLASVSPDYCQLLQVVARVDDWERAYRAIPELLVAFARDLRAVRLAMAPGKLSHGLVAHELAALRESAERLAAHEHELSIIEKAALALAPVDLAAQLRFPTGSELQRLRWVARLAVIPPEDAMREVAETESEIRKFIANPHAKPFALLQASRDLCATRADKILEEYWNQLRAHAREHYVEERDVPDIIQTLTTRYIDSDIRRRQQAQSVAPFTGR